MSYALYRETLETVAKIREAQAASIRASLAETDPEHGEPIPP
jgi:hypothetical protein